MQGLTEAEKFKLAGDIAGTESTSALLAVLNTTKEAYDDMRSSMDSATGSSKAQADIMKKTLLGSFKDLESKVEALIKGSNYLELLKDIDTVVFDKTGTLTEGSFEVVEINGADDLLMLGAYGESMSNHPIAKSILRKYGQEIDQKRISDFKEIAGKGIEVKIDDNSR